MVKSKRIRVTPPGPKAKRIVSKDHKYIATATKTAPIAACKAKGAIVEDVDGNTFIDFASGIGVVNTGHCHPKVVKAMNAQARELVQSRRTKKPAILEVDKILKYCYKHGLVLLPCGTSGIRFIPPLVIKHWELNEGLDILEAAFKKIK